MRELTTASWRVAASRAAHPSAQVVDESILAAIARGLAMVTVPADLRAQPRATEERLLATPTYDAWVRDLPSGSRSAVTRLESEWALAVVSGVLDLEFHLGDATTMRRVHAGEVATVPLGWRLRVIASSGPATVVHVASPPRASSSNFARAATDDRAAGSVRRASCGVGRSPR